MRKYTMSVKICGNMRHKVKYAIPHVPHLNLASVGTEILKLVDRKGGENTVGEGRLNFVSSVHAGHAAAGKLDHAALLKFFGGVQLHGLVYYTHSTHSKGWA